LLEKVAGVHRQAYLPKFHGQTFVARGRGEPIAVNSAAPAFGRKAVLYATCFVNYNNPDIGEALRRVLAHNGVATEVVHPTCCGMPQLEQGDIAAVADKARRTAAALLPHVDQGHDIVALVPSCALMLKSEWPLILPDDANIKRLAKATWDASEYVVDIAREEGLVGGLKPLPGGIALHLACHARAQNIGAKAAELLKFIPDTDVTVIERCSGHGGAWGVRKENFPVALKVGRPVARAAAQSGQAFIASECPLAAEHIVQGMRLLGEDAPKVANAHHPIQLLARAYGLS
jgi:glycerol-3-phosphate dehydrogenase subunit C